MKRFLPRRRSAPGATPLGAGAARVRLAMYPALLAVALAVVLQGANTLRLETVRAADLATLDKAGPQRTFAQQLGRLAALVAAADDAETRRRDAAELAAVLAQARGESAELDRLLAPRLRPSAPAAAAHALRPAVDAWAAARDALWDGAGRVLAAVSSDEAQTSLAGLQAVEAVQAETTQAAAAARHLMQVLHHDGEQRAKALQTQLRWGMGGLLALLVLLGLTVVEPAARSVQRHARRVREQSAELRRLALVAEHTAALVLITDADDRVCWANAAFTRATGWPLAEALDRRPDNLLRHPQADAAVADLWRLAVAQGQGLRHESLHRTRHGSDLWLDIDLRPLLEADGRAGGHVRVCSDVSARRQQQAKLQSLWELLPAGVVVQAPDGSITDANRAAQQMLGRSLAQMQALHSAADPWDVLRDDGSACPAHELPLPRTLAEGRGLRELTLGVRAPDGELRWLLVSTEPQRDAEGEITGVVSCLTDMSERRRLQDKLSDSARTDALTRLPNRAVVLERLQRAIAHQRRHPAYGFAVLFMDFDRFKQINDTLGHGAGDELLRQIALRLTRTLRPGDAVARAGAAWAGGADGGAQVAARLGGDEFVVVLDGVASAATVALIAERLLAELAEPYLVGTSPVQCSASVGVVLCTGAGVPPARLAGDESPLPSAESAAEDVLRNADTAMYEAKRGGRGRWVMFDDSMHERVVRALALEGDLRRALRDDELFVAYQPVVDLATRRLVSVEALVRWRHPQRGMVSPIDFIAAAEECGLIDAVGERVLERACAQFVVWQRSLGAAAPRLLAVNLSRAQLERAGLVAKVAAVLQASGMRAEQLQLEVTESLAAQDERVQLTLRELKSLGVRLALDDFGTGYSSLACLHQMPVDTVKIDRSFVQHAETVEYHRVLIEATIRVARTLGMTTVAEGIETAGQAALMLRLDCDRGQGYLFSRPIEAPALAEWAQAQASLQLLDTA